jgi:hypothetical protein
MLSREPLLASAENREKLDYLVAQEVNVRQQMRSEAFERDRELERKRHEFQMQRSREIVASGSRRKQKITRVAMPAFIVVLLATIGFLILSPKNAKVPNKANPSHSVRAPKPISSKISEKVTPEKSATANRQPSSNDSRKVASNGSPHPGTSKAASPRAGLFPFNVNGKTIYYDRKAPLPSANQLILKFQQSGIDCSNWYKDYQHDAGWVPAANPGKDFYSICTTTPTTLPLSWQVHAIGRMMLSVTTFPPFLPGTSITDISAAICPQNSGDYISNQAIFNFAFTSQTEGVDQNWVSQAKQVLTNELGAIPCP